METNLVDLYTVSAKHTSLSYGKKMKGDPHISSFQLLEKIWESNLTNHDTKSQDMYLANLLIAWTYLTHQYEEDFKWEQI